VLGPFFWALMAASPALRWPLSEGLAGYHPSQNYERNEPLKLERAKGIEPSYEAWEASVLPLNYARALRLGLSPSRMAGEAIVGQVSVVKHLVESATLTPFIEFTGDSVTQCLTGLQLPCSWRPFEMTAFELHSCCFPGLCPTDS
jgi:hypothetical protein